MSWPLGKPRAATTCEKISRAMTKKIDVAVVAGVSREQRRVAVDAACRVLRVPRNMRSYNERSMQKLAGLLKDGATVDEALEVVRYCRARYDGGDTFVKLLKLPYIWSVSEFVPLLTAARSAPAPRRHQSHKVEADWQTAALDKARQAGQRAREESE